MLSLKTVKIGGLNYKVTFTDNVEKGERLFGNISYPELEIRIDNTYPEKIQQLAFLHEIVHGILNHIGKHDLQNDDEFVEVFSNVLYQVLKDNDLNFKKDKESTIEELEDYMEHMKEMEIKEFANAAVEEDKYMQGAHTGWGDALATVRRSLMKIIK